MVFGKTFEDLGFELYYDKLGTRKVLDTDKINVTPGETMDFWLIARPQQRENGIWYHTTYRFLGDAPFIVAGMYIVEDRLNDVSVLSNDNDSTRAFIGKMEEVAIWHRPLDDAEISNYQTNLIGMIGSGTGYKYQTAEEAWEDGLRSYYIPANFQLLGLPFYETDSKEVFLKSNPFIIAGGKHSNSVVLDSIDDTMTISGAKMDYDFTIHTRFSPSEYKTFTIFKSDGIGELWYSAEAGEMTFEVYPFYAPKGVYSFSLPQMTVHKWYDIAVRMDKGRLSIFIDGEQVFYKDFVLSIRGVKSIVNNNNIVEDVKLQGVACLTGCSRRVGDWPEHDLMDRYMSADGVTIDLASAEDALDLLFDPTNNTSAWVGFGNSDQYSHYKYHADDALSDPDHAIFAFRALNGVITVDKDNSNINLKFDTSTECISAYIPHNGFYNIISTACPIRMSVKFKDTFDSAVALTPVITIMQGTRIVKHEFDTVPPKCPASDVDTDPDVCDRKINTLQSSNYKGWQYHYYGYYAAMVDGDHFEVGYLEMENGDIIPFSKHFWANTAKEYYGGGYNASYSPIPFFSSYELDSIDGHYSEVMIRSRVKAVYVPRRDLTSFEDV